MLILQAIISEFELHKGSQGGITVLCVENGGDEPISISGRNLLSLHTSAILIGMKPFIPTARGIYQSKLGFLT